MRTLIGGFRAARDEPFALVPYLAAGSFGALLVGMGVFPARPVTAPVVAVFPIDVYFDVKHWLAHATGWPGLALALGIALAARSALCAATLWIAAGRSGAFAPVWGRAARLAARAAPTFLPGAVFMFAGVALRYAPFVWIGAAAGIAAAARMTRRAAALEVERAISPAAPSVGGVLAYGYLLSAIGALLWVTGQRSPWLSALVLLAAAPLHTLVLLGWRAEAEGEVRPGAERAVAALTATAVVVFGAAAVFDRERGQPAAGPGGPVYEGSLLLLGGADSTTRSGALVDFDPRSVGFSHRDTTLASYRAPLHPYEMADTRRDLRTIAPVIAEQVQDKERPVTLLGHSQAASIVDHMIDAGLELPDSAAVIAAPPPRPPQVSVPPRGENGAGFAAAALTRLLQSSLDAAGLPTFDVDAPAGPTQQEATIVRSPAVPRLAVWALGDSVWLDDDWRRPGESNVVVLTDHVGAVKNPHSLAAVRGFFGNAHVPSHERDWRSVLVNVVRFTFEPWRP